MTAPFALRHRSWPPGFVLLMAAQFVSALADNALLIVSIALLQQRGLPGWWAPLLKFSFTLAYVLLAPFVGALADAMPKGRLMLWMNLLKAAGLLALLAGLHPLAALAWVGVGAAFYAPAKYGLVTELVPPRQLVAANGWIEVCTVCAALFGGLLGGMLVSDAVGALAQAAWPGLAPLPAALWLLLGVYAAAAALNLGVPDSGARYRRHALGPLALLRQFARAHCRLWRDAEGGLSMAVTTLFWGAAAVLQYGVLQWADEMLGLPLDRAAYLQALVAMGVVAGAAAAGRWVRLAQATRVLPAGVVLGLLVPFVAWAPSAAVALPLLWAVGAMGGALVVPMNALLQHRGHQLLTAGRSIAVQNFNENASVLVMLAVYAGLLYADVGITGVLTLFGLVVAGVMGLLIWRERRRQAGALGAAVQGRTGSTRL